MLLPAGAAVEVEAVVESQAELSVSEADAAPGIDEVGGMPKVLNNALFYC